MYLIKYIINKEVKISDLQVLVPQPSKPKKTAERGTERLPVKEWHRSVSERDHRGYTGLEEKILMVSLT